LPVGGAEPELEHSGGHAAVRGGMFRLILILFVAPAGGAEPELEHSGGHAAVCGGMVRLILIFVAFCRWR
jgi:hypothetical protein